MDKIEFTENFKKCILKTLQFEGGYSNDPDDPGAETVFGISRKYHPDWIGWDVIDSIEDKSSIDLSYLKSNNDLFYVVSKFYFEDFYRSSKADKIEELSPELACNVFDFAVNAGVKTSDKTLQSAINLAIKMYGVETDEDYLVVDGLPGSKTFTTLKSVIDICGEYKVIEAFKTERALYYTKLPQRNEHLCKYVYGWVKRALTFSV